MPTETIASAIAAPISLGNDLTVEGYLLTDETFRYGLGYLGPLLGYAEYFVRLSKNPNNKKLKLLQLKGYSAQILDTQVNRPEGRGSTIAKTVSFDDFCILLEHEASISNPKAIALHSASFREVLRSRSLAAFGLPDDPLSQKLTNFDQSHADYLAREQMFQENREDVEAQWMPGDDLYYPTYRDWENISSWGDEVYIDYDDC